MIQEISKNKAKLIINVGSRDHRQRYTKTVEYKGKRELKRLHDEFEREVRSGHMPSEMTVAELLSWHIGVCETNGAKPTTIRGYKICEKRINSLCKGRKSNSLTTYHIENMVSQMANNRLAPKTIKETIALLSSAYKHAMKSGMLTNNPCDGVQLPKMKKNEINTLSLEEIAQFKENLQNEPIYFRIAMNLALMCGLRRSEILGLRVEDISFAFGLISVKTTRHEVNGEVSIQDTKTVRSRRTIAVPEQLLRDMEIFANSNRNFANTNFFLVNEFGEPLKPNYLTAHLKLHCKKYNYNVTVHGLRHTHATFLNANGIDMAQISAQLGHSNLSTTANIYTHVFGGQHQSTKAIANLFNENVPPMCHPEQIKNA